MPKILYFINMANKIVLYTDASDTAHGAYLCQVVLATAKTEEHEEPIRLLSRSFNGAQTRWSTPEKEAFSIYWALGRLDDLLGGIAFIIRTDHRNLLHVNNNGSLAHNQKMEAGYKAIRALRFVLSTL